LYEYAVDVSNNISVLSVAVAVAETIHSPKSVGEAPLVATADILKGASFNALNPAPKDKYLVLVNVDIVGLPFFKKTEPLLTSCG
jgi:hypothetical protein